mmetsp:Transcript_19620/g.49282  ORF Transcript_19620/g.49282 Transcript_19620/m.49282 type:complete len:201 (+) Transcript_19620:192-794(+)
MLDRDISLSSVLTYDWNRTSLGAAAFCGRIVSGCTSRYCHRPRGLCECVSVAPGAAGSYPYRTDHHLRNCQYLLSPAMASVFLFLLPRFRGCLHFHLHGPGLDHFSVFQHQVLQPHVVRRPPTRIRKSKNPSERPESTALRLQDPGRLLQQVLRFRRLPHPRVGVGHHRDQEVEEHDRGQHHKQVVHQNGEALDLFAPRS